MGFFLCTGRSHTRFCGGLSPRGVEKIRENLSLLIFCEFTLVRGSIFGFEKVIFEI